MTLIPRVFNIWEILTRISFVCPHISGLEHVLPPAAQTAELVDRVAQLN